MEINARTQLCGLLGNPVEHSLSPAIHNAAFQKLGLNFVYLAFRVERIADALCGLRALENVRGFSVTIPHKVTVLSHLDEIEPTARHIGAINTIVVEHGRLTGHNTDASGALRALVEAEVPLRGKSVLLLGSGGAARAIAFALVRDAGVGALTILGVDAFEGRALADDLRAKTRLEVRHAHLGVEILAAEIPTHTVLLHCTPVGMHPHAGETCVPADLLKPHLAVMDIVYNPLETQLLRDARAAGCQTIKGLEMFVNQAVAQFELWTGRPAPSDVMRAVLQSHLS